jgi:MarR family
VEKLTEKVILQEGFDRLKTIMEQGPGLELIRMGQPTDSAYDDFWYVKTDNWMLTILVEAKSNFTPRAVEQLDRVLSPSRLGRMGDPMVLITAPWLSPRSRDVIEERGWSYLDLAGNVLLRSQRPPLYIRLTGSDENPAPRSRAGVLLRGSHINALVRILVDVNPPYRLSDLARVTGLSMGYVSRTLTTLHEQGLIERKPNGPVAQVRWPELLRERSIEYDLLKSNNSATFLTRGGPEQLFRRLGQTDTAAKVTVTGSFAARTIAPVAPSAQLALYVPDIRSFANDFELLPTRSGANVLLLEAASTSQLDRSRPVDNLPHVGYSQLVQDLLGGNGRLPEEGEAILEWMIDTPGWRLPHLPEITH